MTNTDAIKWLENLKKDIGNPAHQSLWHYEQALTEIIEMLDGNNKSKDEPQTKLCRECDDYAGNGMYCASNHIVYDFSTSKENCELQTKQQTKRPWGMYIIEHPMYE